MKANKLIKAINNKFSKSKQKKTKVRVYDNTLRIYFEGVYPFQKITSELDLFRYPDNEPEYNAEKGKFDMVRGKPRTLALFIDAMNRCFSESDEVSFVESYSGYRCDSFDDIIVDDEGAICTIVITLDTESEDMNTNCCGFEEHLCQQGDAVDNAAYALACAMAGKELEWSQEYIGEIVDSAESILLSLHIPTCHPWSDGDYEIPCYLTDECDNPNCLLKIRG